ncbi:MAG: hypothetical protein M5U34_40060 [Chloroflexi bacterium]|nr:hypothetical protein [Chloroflexota bacterium]
MGDPAWSTSPSSGMRRHAEHVLADWMFGARFQHFADGRLAGGEQ